MAKHSKFENDRRAAETVRIKEIEAAWLGSLSKPAAEAFNQAVAAARGPSAPGPVAEHAARHAPQPAQARAATDEGRDEPPSSELTLGFRDHQGSQIQLRVPENVAGQPSALMEAAPEPGPVAGSLSRLTSVNVARPARSFQVISADPSQNG